MKNYKIMKNYKKTEHFEAVAMKCNEEQFNELKPILENFGLKIKGFESYKPILVNNLWGEENVIQTLEENKKIDFNRVYHSKFNAETFLKACGIVEIEKTYQLSERQKNELIKEPNIKDFFIREGIIDETIEIKKSTILNTPNDLELGQLIRKML